jgi:arginyl-tRNA synthetase
MQYSYARVKSIFEKGNVDQSAIPAGATGSASAIRLTTPHERALAVSLLQFAEALDRVVNDYRPNHLTAYLFELATRYSTFFEHCPVLRAETEALRGSRLLLCDLTARTLARGLDLLGIQVAERM